ncbi:glycosyltransferase [Parabacteroides sp. FAFU027]|uniref:glycosyltransferase n=1 Tax=Parabacteroides sp. FAFU027 TaxID=2922715 RepID=UPI001FAE8F48|nr:glycosyltransferase [Parabacteroides sp. FAFU027]
MNNQPLISIIVITYNSSKYVIETLESAKSQTYQNIELIVSDDCSSDNTVELCRDWIKENNYRFVRTKVVTVVENSGISPNCNRGLSAAEGEWVKLIAGDDVLLDNCITDFVSYCQADRECKILVGRLFYWKGDTVTEDKINPFYKLSQENQYLRNVKGSGVPIQASFFNKNSLVGIGGFDEKYKYIEDLPLWIKASELGFYFNFLDKFVVKYRLHDNNISGVRRNTSYYINERFYKEHRSIIKNEVIPRLILHREYVTVFNFWNYLVVCDVILLLGNKNNLLSRVLSLLNLKSTVLKLKRCMVGED